MYLSYEMGIIMSYSSYVHNIILYETFISETQKSWLPGKIAA